MNKFLEGFKEGQKLFGELISGIINSILLTLVYVLGVGLSSVLGKISRKRFLDTKIDLEKDSYWEVLNLNKKPLEDYSRQF